jgi:hypothetical protein
VLEVVLGSTGQLGELLLGIGHGVLLLVQAQQGVPMMAHTLSFAVRAW